MKTMQKLLSFPIALFHDALPLNPHLPMPSLSHLFTQNSRLEISNVGGPTDKRCHRDDYRSGEYIRGRTVLEITDL